MTSPEEQAEPRVVITDKRRLDPTTGEPREPVDVSAGEPRLVEGEVLDAAPEAPSEQPPGAAREDELLADLQRVTAEYANYRKRVDRDRITVVETATLGMLESLLPLLDNVELARQHGDLEGAFKGVGEGLEQLAERHGLERYGAKGDVFDPAVHHALVQAPPDETATETTVADVLQPGWRLRSGRVLRPAGVAVSEPGSAVQES